MKTHAHTSHRGHDFDLLLDLPDHVEPIRRAQYFQASPAGQRSLSSDFDCAGTLGCAGSFGGTVGTLGTFGCCC